MRNIIDMMRLNMMRGRGKKKKSKSKKSKSRSKSSKKRRVKRGGWGGIIEGIQEAGKMLGGWRGSKLNLFKV